MKTSYGKQGFTLIELMTVVAVVGVLAGLLLISVSKARARSRSIECLSNSRQISIALQTYSDDFEGAFPANSPEYATSDGKHWVPGLAGRGQVDEFAPSRLQDRSITPIAPYNGGSTRNYKCPFDLRRGVASPALGMASARQVVDASRTISLNQAVGTNPKTGPKAALDAPWLDGNESNTAAGPFRTYPTLAAMVSPGPADLWTTIDEDLISLNDGSFAVSMTKERWVDWPGSYHDGRGRVSFADGHVEQPLWKTPPKLTPPGENRLIHPDWVWLTVRTSVRINSVKNPE